MEVTLARPFPPPPVENAEGHNELGCPNRTDKPDRLAGNAEKQKQK
jgi:hypothetical protein